jgi:hypothetical protein
LSNSRLITEILVIAGLVPAIHPSARVERKSQITPAAPWIAETSPAMTGIFSGRDE